MEHTIERGAKTVAPFRRHFPFLLTMVTAGLRLGEVAALQVKDIDWQNGVITVERSFVRGKIGLPKHDKIRRVHVPEGLLDVLAHMISDRFDKVKEVDAEMEAERQIEAANLQLDTWLFPDATGKRPMDTNNFRYRVWVPLLKAAKLQHRKIHNLRHTYASFMLQEGRELHFVSAQLGHADPAFTFRTYGYLIPRDRRSEVSFLDGIMPGNLHQPAPQLHPELEEHDANLLSTRKTARARSSGGLERLASNQ